MDKSRCQTLAAHALNYYVQSEIIIIHIKLMYYSRITEAIRLIANSSNHIYLNVHLPTKLLHLEYPISGIFCGI